MQLSNITPLILTFNESANLQASLSALDWANRILVIDSGSTDSTLRIAAAFPQVEVAQRPFDNHTNQWNYGLELVDTDWVLTLDADYVCMPELATELAGLNPIADVFFSHFCYCVFGRRLRGSLYPPRAILFDPRKRQYIPDGHTQTLDVRGAKAGYLYTMVMHDDRKPLARWYASQVKYAMLESEKLSLTDDAALSWKDLIRKKVIIAPFLTLFYCLIAKRLILDGWAGMFYTFQRVSAELILSLVLLERKLRNTTEPRAESNNEPTAHE